jgi:HD-GYP domain-containing protein (c-di-GMP phosphodiesterase class II)
MVYNTTMVKMSDIFKKLEERKKEAKTAQPITEHAEPQKATANPSFPEASCHPDHHHIETKIEPEMPQTTNSHPVISEAEVLALAECEKAYEEARLLTEELMKENTLYELIDSHRISAIVEKLVSLAQSHPGNMTALALNPDRSTQTSYILCHMVNVSILSILVGIELEYAPYRLKELGAAALLHDVGMVFYQSLVNQDKTLTPEEYEKIKNHTLLAAKILQSIKGLDDVVFVVARQHHEHMNGTGYPDKLMGDQIHEYSRIVTVLNVYEAMMHRRTYRTKFQARDTIQEILKNKNFYDLKLIKILINRIGIFPIGSLVELNTKELARVVNLNIDNILRPVVKIITKANGEEAVDGKIVNLATEPALWIRHMDDKE